MKVAVFGSAFNPPTKGHLDAIEFVLAHEEQFERVVLVPSFQHAFAKSMLTYSHRVAMVIKFVEDINDERVLAMPIEHTISDGENPVYTYDVMCHLQQTPFSNDSLTFVVGPDNHANWSKFYKAKEIDDKWGRVVVPERKPIRSTKVRNAIENNESISHLVTPGVASYIQEHQLYAR